MSSEERPVASAADLAAACKNADLRRITVRGSIANAPPVRRAPGQSLQGENDQAEIAFAAGSDGLQFSSDNQVRRGFSGSAREIEIDGGIVTNGEGIPPLELHGEIQSLRAAGGFAARGGGFDRI